VIRGAPPESCAKTIPSRDTRPRFQRFGSCELPS